MNIKRNVYMFLFVRFIFPAFIFLKGYRLPCNKPILIFVSGEEELIELLYFHTNEFIFAQFLRLKFFPGIQYKRIFKTRSTWGNRRVAGCVKRKEGIEFLKACIIFRYGNVTQFVFISKLNAQSH